MSCAASCVVSLFKPAASAFLVLLLGVVVVGFAPCAARANDGADATLLHSWCIARGDLPPDCVHDDPLTCNINAFLTGGACIKAEPIPPPATTVAAAPVRPQKMARRKLPADRNDKLFREFERWKRNASN